MYLVSYDIDKDRIRNKVAKTLENYGKRVQYSVFECDIDQQKYEDLYSQLANILSGKVEGNIRFYFLCNACVARIAVLGSKTDSDMNDLDDLFII